MMTLSIRKMILHGNYTKKNVYSNSASPSKEAEYLDSVCCLDAVFNGYQKWQENADSDYVKSIEISKLISKSLLVKQFTN